MALVSAVWFLLCPSPAFSSATNKPSADLWVLQPVVRPAVPSAATSSTNPIDAFIASAWKAKGLTPAAPAVKPTLLRRVYLDLTGLPPSPEAQEAFLHDSAPDAYEKVVDKLLGSEQHAVRYARHWLDVLRYADVDERMLGAAGIYLWRDWVINALNEDLPFDQFVRAQLTGYRSSVRTQMSATGYRARSEPRPDDLFALGFLARGAVLRDGKDAQELSITAVETVSTAFMGLTVGCAKCHDHMYDPITKRDFYAMKALFDPLVVRKVLLATPADLVAAGKTIGETARKRAAIEEPLNQLAAPYKEKLYAERLAMLPPEAQAVMRKPEKERSPAERKVADDYFPILRIDSDKITEIMPEADRRKYRDLQSRLTAVGGGNAGRGRGGGQALAAFWTVEVDHAKELQKSHLLTSGDPERPEMDHEVEAGWPFEPPGTEFPEGRIEAFSDWLTAPENPLFARVAVNRLWQWHFGEGLQKTPSDFGALGGAPSHPELLDWLASEFVRLNFSMKQMHRLIVTSEAYKLASDASPALEAANSKADPENRLLWRFRLQRLEAEPIWDSIFTAADTLDLSVDGPSFDPAGSSGRRGGRRGAANASSAPTSYRRAAYMTRGYSTSADVMPNFLQAFDVDDGRAPCPMRTRTVTAPQSLFMMNSPEIEKASAQFAARLQEDSDGDLKTAVDLAYQITLARPPSASEHNYAVEYLGGDPARLKNLAWLLFNLDEFVYLP